MKKYLMTIILPLIACLFFAMPVSAAHISSGKCGDNATWILDSKGVLTISGTGAIDNKTEYGKYQSEIKRIIIKEGITEIGEASFYRYTNLKGNIKFPKTLEKIGNYAFEKCHGLTGDLIIPENVKVIGSGAFSGCTGFDGDFKLPKQMESIGSGAFENCSNITGDIIIPNGIITIEPYLFENCTSLDGKLVIPDTVTFINGYAFRNCSGLKGKLYLSENLEKISSGVFNDCKKLSGELNIPENLEVIGHDAFKNCFKLGKVVNLGKNVRWIGTGAFAGCNSINTIVINNPYCKIYDFNDETMFPEKATIVSYHASTAKTYASFNSRKYEDINRVLLDKTEFFYNNTEQKPSVVIKDYFGNELDEGIDYKVEYPKESINACKYNIRIDYIKVYNQGQAKPLYVEYYIYPEKLSDVKTELYNEHNTVKISWDKCEGASGYNLYYKTSKSSKYMILTKTSELFYIADDLDENKNYYYKVEPYIEIDESIYSSEKCSNTSTIKTKKNVPAPTTVKASLYGYDDVKVSWSKSSGASGYYVYYKKEDSEKYTYLKRTTSRNCKKSSLSDGVRYTFKIVPYYKSGSSKIKSYYSETVDVETLKKVKSLTMIADVEHAQVALEWEDIKSESGYQVSKSTSKNGTNIVTTISEADVTSATLNAKAGRAYYYKVRAYKIVSGKKICAPWSDSVKFIIE